MRSILYIILCVGLATLPLGAAGQLDIFSPSNGGESAFPVDLVWRANTFVPGGYAGKALPTSGSAVTVSALTPTRPATRLLFVWEADDRLGGQGPEKSGVGENEFTFLTSPLRAAGSYEISVTVRDEQLGEVGRASVSVPVAAPEVRLRVFDEERGTVSRAIESARVRPGSRISLLAQPYFFNVREAGTLAFSWLFGNRPVSSSGREGVLDLSISERSGAVTQSARVEALRPGTGERAGGTVQIFIQP